MSKSTASTLQQNRFLIVGAGIAGLTAATTIRSLDRNAEICLINSEAYAPYKRTNLSKFLASGFQPDDFTLVTEKDLSDFYKIELVADTITQVDYQNNRAFGKELLSGQGAKQNGAKAGAQAGRQYDYDFLILATGARYDVPKALQNERVKYFHNKQETLALIEALGPAKKVAILGAGVQGLETCYELLKLGKEVSIIDPHTMPLAHFLARSPVQNSSGSGSSAYIIEWLQKDLAQRNVHCIWNTRIQEYRGSILEDFDLTICCFGTKTIENLLPEGAKTQENLLLTAGNIPNNVFICGDNIRYPDGGRCTLWHEAMDMGQLAGRNAVHLSRLECSERGTPLEQLTRSERKPYRCKIELAEHILSLAPPVCQSASSERSFMHEGSYYQFFLDEREQLLGAYLLCDDRDLLKPLEEVVWGQLPHEAACKQLGIPLSVELA